MQNNERLNELEQLIKWLNRLLKPHAPKWNLLSEETYRLSAKLKSLEQKDIRDPKVRPEWEKIFEEYKKWNEKVKSPSTKFLLDSDFHIGPKNPLLTVPHDVLLDLQSYLQEAHSTWEYLLGRSAFKFREDRDSSQVSFSNPDFFLDRKFNIFFPDFIKQWNKISKSSRLLNYITRVLAAPTPSQGYKLTLASIRHIRAELSIFLRYLRTTAPSSNL